MDEETREIRDEVEEARENLGDTVEALAYKANAPKRAKDQATEKLHAAKTAATTKVNQAKKHASTRAEDAKATIANSRNGGTAAAGMSARMEPAVGVVKRHPTVTAAAAIGAVAGIMIGRLTKA